MQVAPDPYLSGEAQPSLEPRDDAFAAALRGFGPIGLLAILVVLAAALLPVPLSPVLVLLWTARSRTPWSAIGYVRPRSWIGTILVGVVVGVALKLLIKAVVMPRLGAAPLNQAYQFLVGDQAAMLGTLFMVIVVGGWGEETLYRGYLFERLGKLLGKGPLAKAVIVVLTSTLFGLLHLHDQGWAGAEQAILTGLTFGTIFAVTGRIWLPMFAHAAYDVTAVLIIYAGLERQVAHWFFR